LNIHILEMTVASYQYIPVAYVIMHWMIWP